MQQQSMKQEAPEKIKQDDTCWHFNNFNTNTQRFILTYF